MGMDPAREARAKVRAFMDSRLDNYEEIQRVVYRTRLVVVADPRTKRTEINPAKIIEIGIVEIWESEWILPHLKGEDRDRYLEDTVKINLANGDCGTKISISVGDDEFTFG